MKVRLIKGQGRDTLVAQPKRDQEGPRRLFGKKQEEALTGRFSLEQSVKGGKGEIEARQKRLIDLKNLVRCRLTEKKRHSNMVPPDPTPRYDEMFFEGTAWLDNQAGDPLEEVE